MTPVWRVARAAVGRRRLQTTVIALVVAVSTALVVLGVALLAASSAPFDRAFDQQDGAHLVAAFDSTTVSGTELTRAADRPAVAAIAGPFGLVDLDTEPDREFDVPATLTTVGRADPGGPVDRVDVWAGRWVSAPGEVVLNRIPGDAAGLGTRLRIPGGRQLTVVGFAHSVSRSADAWVTPDQMAALRPTTTQMLYRFHAAATPGQVDAGRTAVTAGLPAGALLGSQSYLTVREKITSDSAGYIPFLVVFAVLGITLAVLIVANVVSGAVVSGFRHIGVLKALGFTPNQVMAVYLTLVAVPAVVGCVLGTVAGHLVARPILADTFATFGTSDVGVPAWADAVALLGMPALVALAALVSALRARRLSPTEAISAGSAPRPGRALTVQRRLGGTRLPRSVSLGLGMPFARPARSGLTLAAVVLGVMTVTLAIGVTLSVNAYDSALRPVHPDRIDVRAGLPEGLLPRDDPAAPASPELSDAEDEALLRSLPGAVAFAAVSSPDVQVLGGTQGATVQFYRGDGAGLGPEVLHGRWPDGAGEVAASSRFLNQRRLVVGDTITVGLDGNRTPVEIVGVVLVNNEDTLVADWATLERLDPDPRADSYVVQLSPVTDRRAVEDAVAAGDPGLEVLPPRDSTSDTAVALIGSAVLLTVLLSAVAALGVFNTVVLDARERRRDLGMLKSIGMTPRQVTVMMVTSMGALGVVGGLLGLPLGVLAHRLVTPAMLEAAQSDVFDFVVDVYRVPALVLLGLAGVTIAVLGALLPARSAARMPIAAVLHNE